MDCGAKAVFEHFLAGYHRRNRFNFVVLVSTEELFADPPSQLMKNSVNYIILTIFFALVFSVAFQSASAQDASYPVEGISTETEVSRDEITYAGEGDAMINNKVRIVSPRDSATTRSTRPIRPETAKPAGRASTEDDSILSFNFLYYIFEKYKMQDVVD